MEFFVNDEQLQLLRHFRCKGHMKDHGGRILPVIASIRILIDIRPCKNRPMIRSLMRGSSIDDSADRMKWVAMLKKT